MVPARSTLHEFMPYGAPDLLAQAPATGQRALAMAMGLWSLAFLLAVMLVPLAPHPEVRSVMPTFEIRPFVPQLPDPIRPVRLPSVHPIAPSAKHEFATPVPVPDARSPVVNDSTGFVRDASVSGKRVDRNPTDGIDNAPPDDRPDPGIWVLHDTEPELVHPVVPEYPAIAQEARVEGTVYVQALVSREGSVSETIVRRGDPMLVAAAVEAARASRFRPAMANGHAVAVWVMMPFRFVLH